MRSLNGRDFFTDSETSWQGPRTSTPISSRHRACSSVTQLLYTRAVSPQGLDWAAPRAQAALSSAIERATPLVESASERAQSVADRAQPFLSDIHGHVVDDYLPRLNKAVSESATALAAEGDLSSRARAARSASAKALTTPARKKKCCKKGRLLRALCFTALTAAAAGAGYVLWKRSQPIEDPWAEDYWADLEVEDYSADQNQEASAE